VFLLCLCFACCDIAHNDATRDDDDDDDNDDEVVAVAVVVACANE